MTSVAPLDRGLEGFRLGEELGQGGFAKVWAAERKEDGAPAAIKVGHTRSALLIERFRREASALARIGAPHTAQLYCSGQLEDGRPYIAMERLFGKTLATELGELSEPPGSSWAVQRAEAILEALAAAHAREITHRDLKPSNILITHEERQAVLIDYGLAHGAFVPEGAPSILTRPGVAVGTPIYMAPEQIRSEPFIDARADIYAFGVLLFELLTLRTPFVGAAGVIEYSHLSLRPPRPSEFAPVPAELDELTLACLAKDPARRPKSVEEIRRALVEAVAVPSRPPPSIPPSSGGGRLVAEAGPPEVLLVVELAGAAPPVIAAIAARGGFIVRRRANRYVSLFLAEEIVDPAQAALAAARELVDKYGARAALHLGSVILRPREQGPPAVYGAPVDRPDTWLPEEPWTGISRTAEIESILSDPARLSKDSESTTEERPALFGRDDVRAALEESAAAAFDGACPGLFTLLGDDGMGKTCLAALAAEVAERAAEGAQVISIQATPRVHEAGYGKETLALLQALLKDTLPPYRELVRALAEGLKEAARGRPLAVIIDDADRADDALLDALEIATLDGAGVRLWAVVIAHPRLLASRPVWGARTERCHRMTLAPLDEPAGMELAAWLLRPADYLPMETLRRLAAFAGGNPECLVDLVRSLRRVGVVRQRPNGRGYEVATAALDELPPSLPQRWLAARRLAELPAALAALVRVAAVFSPVFTEEKLAAVLEGLDRAGGASSPLDAGVGLSALSAGSIVRRVSGTQWAFSSAVFKEAIEALVDPAHRSAIHGEALLYWRARATGASRTAEALEAIARHAASSGEHAEAAGALLELGEGALGRHRYVEADLRFSAAFGHLDAGDAALRVSALAGRGRARYRIHRAREAREDFAAAIAVAEELGDRRRKAELLLEDATALDWDQQFDASAARVEEARPIVEALGEPRLALRLKVADGRTCHRRREREAAITLLEGASAEAASMGELEALIIALLLLSAELAVAGRLEEAERKFDEVIALAESTGDLLHLGAAYNNRGTLWMARGLPDRAVEDLYRVITLSREIGNPLLELRAAYNVALMLYWSDTPEAALTFARRACLLVERTAEALVPVARLLLAEILLLLEQYEEAVRVLEAMRGSAHQLDPVYIPSHQMLQRVLSELGIGGFTRPEGGWEQIMRFARENGLLRVEGELKLLYWRARMALIGGRLEEASAALDAARERRPGSVMWLRRFEALEAELARGSGAGQHRPLEDR